jgi:hypothetical protein
MPLVRVKLKPSEMVVKKSEYTKTFNDELAYRTKTQALEEKIAILETTSISQWGDRDVDKIVNEAVASFISGLDLNTLIKTEMTKVVNEIVAAYNPAIIKDGGGGLDGGIGGGISATR